LLRRKSRKCGDGGRENEEVSERGGMTSGKKNE
jgi:hypothetical protein